MLSRRTILAMGTLPMWGAPRRRLLFGAQTNAWRIGGFADLALVLDKLRGYGYDGFETSYRAVQSEFEDPAAARDRIAASGLRFFAVHIWLPENQYDAETRLPPESLYQKVAPGAKKLGAETLVMSGLPPASGAGSMEKKIAALNRAGAFAQSAGLPLAYHNEFLEFEHGAGEMDRLVESTDPKLVNFVLDAGHAFHAGVDVPAYFRKHSARILAVHLRDFVDGNQVPLGEGRFPLEEFAAAIRQSGWSGWLLNEEERPNGRPGDAAIGPAHRTLVRVFGGIE